ncbi:hypothetical protein EG68_01394 [Paragonimus skrjabini miyazakii]|uniref:Uncharacterized protein n=1 Tax=Paragonimus skrjabini miyazakii TaxID=59628 RepID=A0A8S9Z7F2_9TREM|nr:hypothetical protein EG68_01394 [Paragonimus skrjabini miyazakii]
MDRYRPRTRLIKSIVSFVVISSLLSISIDAKPQVKRRDRDEETKLEITCIENQREYCKDKKVGFKFNDGCRECQCKEDDSYCKTPECAIQVDVDTDPEKYCAEILEQNTKAGYGDRGQAVTKEAKEVELLNLESHENYASESPELKSVVMKDELLGSPVEEDKLGKKASETTHSKDDEVGLLSAMLGFPQMPNDNLGAHQDLNELSKSSDSSDLSPAGQHGLADVDDTQLESRHQDSVKPATSGPQEPSSGQINPVAFEPHVDIGPGLLVEGPHRQDTFGPVPLGPHDHNGPGPLPVRPPVHVGFDPLPLKSGKGPTGPRLLPLGTHSKDGPVSIPLGPPRGKTIDNLPFELHPPSGLGALPVEPMHPGQPVAGPMPDIFMNGENRHADFPLLGAREGDESFDPIADHGPDSPPHYSITGEMSQLPHSPSIGKDGVAPVNNTVQGSKQPPADQTVTEKPNVDKISNEDKKELLPSWLNERDLRGLLRSDNLKSEGKMKEQSTLNTIDKLISMLGKLFSMKRLNNYNGGYKRPSINKPLTASPKKDVYKESNKKKKNDIYGMYDQAMFGSPNLPPFASYLNDPRMTEYHPGFNMYDGSRFQDFPTGRPIYRGPPHYRWFGAGPDWNPEFVGDRPIKFGPMGDFGYFGTGGGGGFGPALGPGRMDGLYGENGVFHQPGPTGLDESPGMNFGMWPDMHPHGYKEVGWQPDSNGPRIGREGLEGVLEVVNQQKSPNITEKMDVNGTDNETAVGTMPVVNKIQPSDAFLMVARILSRVPISSPAAVAPTSEMYASPVHGPLYGNGQYEHYHRSQVTLADLFRRIKLLQREVEQLRFKYQNCESYRQRIRYALQTRISESHNAAPIGGKFLNTAASLVVGMHLFNQII